jgi:cellulose synthase/poly-beta-1,6-N-acetylglucosamine synthase-like glycosyltransferase
MIQQSASNPRYVLVTAAHNEQGFVENTLQSVVSQEVPPRKWVIVDDASTDDTATIVREYALKYSFIQLLELSEHHAPDFGAQVRAINAGCDLLWRSEIDFDFIGNLDSDISFEKSYFCELIRKFEADPTLGLAGGWLYENRGGKFEPRKGNRTSSVPHAIQLFRRSCFQAIGGYVPLRYGAPDWCAEVSVRMNRSRVQSFPDLPVFHHRMTGGVSGRLPYLYRSGLAAFSLGSHPGFELAKCAGRLHERPYFLAALSRLAGFAVGCYRREERQVSREFVRFLRHEQTGRLCGSLLAPLSAVRRVQNRRLTQEDERRPDATCDGAQSNK